MTPTQLDLTFLRDLVHREAGIVVEPEKDYLVSSRLTPVAQQLGFRGIPDLVRDLRHHPSAHTTAQITAAMTVNETLWFRDGAPFHTLRTEVLPALARSRPGRLRLWSAACSSGQEAYSALITALETPDLIDFDLEMLATDLSPAMVERTRAGRYSPVEIGRGLGVDRLARWFERDGEQWVVGPELARCVTAKVANLCRPLAVHGHYDVVLLRNVLIYFDVATKREVLGRVRRVIAPDGLLLLGATESTVGVDDSWAAVPGSPGLYRPR